MATILWIIAVVLVISGIVTLIRGQMLFGILLIVVGLLMVTDYFTILASYLQALTPEFLRSRI